MNQKKVPLPPTSRVIEMEGSPATGGARGKWVGIGGR